MDFSGFFEKLRAAVQNQASNEKKADEQRPPREAYMDEKTQVVVPFSFQVDQNGARQYGMAYIPATEARRYAEDMRVRANKLGNTGSTPLDYGITKAELSTGKTIDADTFKDLYNTYKKANFSFDTQWGMVDANDEEMMKETRKYITAQQKASRESAAQKFFRNFKSNMGKGRA